MEEAEHQKSKVGIYQVQDCHRRGMLNQVLGAQPFKDKVKTTEHFMRRDEKYGYHSRASYKKHHPLGVGL
jgi:hypothetical protein